MHRRRAGWAVAAGLVALLVAAVAFALADRGPAAHRSPPPVPAAHLAPTTLAPTTTATTAPTTTQGPLTAAQAAAQLAAAVQQVSASGDLTPGAAGPLAKQATDLERAVADGKPGPVGHMVADLITRLDGLVRDGQLTPAGRAAFDAPLAALQQLYPASGPGAGGGGDHGGDGRG